MSNKSLSKTVMHRFIDHITFLNGRKTDILTFGFLTTVVLDGLPISVPTDLEAN